MKRPLLTVCAFFNLIICVAQTTQVKYYDSKYREVPERKARYVKVISANSDSSVTTTETDLKTGDVRSSTYKNLEPYGIWKTRSGELDYKFTLAYSDDDCDNGEILPKLDNYFEDAEDFGYTAPKVSKDDVFNKFLAQNIRYPQPAKENGIQGRVLARFTIGKDGTVSNICIVKGVDKVLDKEYVRVLRKLKFAVPPMINGQPVELCVKASCAFRLE